MRHVTLAVLSGALSGLLAVMLPAIAHAKRSYGDDTPKHRSVTGHRHASGGDGGSRSCLTRDARAILNSIEAQFGRVEIVSTCRKGARIATSGRPSKHASGEAIDFRVPGKKKQVVSWLINNHGGGTMTYSDMDHIHVDVGHHFVALNRPSGH
jgi:Peptidase M15